MKRIFLFIAFICFVSAQSFAQSFDERVNSYLQNYGSLAIKEQQRTGIPASIKLAQGILETGAGASELCNNANNHFGIKCKSNWIGDTYAYTDDAKDECFRKYPSLEHSFIDHSDFLVQNKRYAPLFKHAPENYKAWANGLKQCGYATNPAYAKKLIELIEKYDLNAYTLSAQQITLPLSNHKAPVEAAIKKTDIVSDKKEVSDIISLSDEKPIRQINQESVKYVFTNQQTNDQSSLTKEYYVITQLNNLKGFWAKKGDMILEFAIRHKVRYAKLLDINELADEPLYDDLFIYLEKKHKFGPQEMYTVQQGETIHKISQNIGMLSDQVRQLNKLNKEEEPAPGTVLYLKSYVETKPKTVDAIVKQTNNNEERLNIGYGAVPPKSSNTSNYIDISKNSVKEAPELVKEHTVASEITQEKEIEQKKDNIEEYKSIKQPIAQEIPTTTLPAKNDISELDKLKEKMDQSVYSQKQQSSSTTTSSDPSKNTLQEHMERRTGNFTPKQTNP